MYIMLILLLGVCKVVLAIEFTIASGPCPGDPSLMSRCESASKGGLCAFTGEVPWSWCCIPNEQFCGNWGQKCTGAGNLAGKDQIFCAATGGGPETWCCDNKSERCVGPGLFNWCVAKSVKNPYNETSVASALSLKSEHFATTTSRSTSTFSTSSSATQTVSTSSSITSASANANSQSSLVTTSSTTSDSSSSTSTSSASPTPTQPASAAPVSNGAIAGIVIGGVVGMAFIALAIFFGLRSRHQKEEDPTHSPTTPAAHELGGKTAVKELSDSDGRAELPPQQRYSEMP